MKVHVIYIILVAVAVAAGVYFYIEGERRLEERQLLYEREIDSLKVIYHSKDSLLEVYSKRGTKYEIRYRNNPKPIIPTLNEQQLDRAIDSILYRRP